MRTLSVCRVPGTCLAVAAFASLPLSLYAHSYGPKPGVTAAPGDDSRACTACHAGGALNSFSGSVKIALTSGPVYIPGVKQRITVQLTDPTQQRWGFELTARLDSNPQTGQAGDFTPVDSFTQTICGDYGPEPCSSGVVFIEHTSAGTRKGTTGGATFQFDWTPPAAGSGSVTMYVAGNAANGDGTPGGDHIYASSIQLQPVTPVAPVVTAGNVVSAATSAPGPVAPNSWVSVYGTNLGVTTRAWNSDNSTNGQVPFTLDGVSVLLTGSPRLAYVGYVSPTQVNFLVPSDATAGTYQVQVRNPAGIASQVPITVQANAAQLLTLNGTYVLATHANGSLVGKAGLLSSVASTPATAGETITLYSTGSGATNPALVPGVTPVQAEPVVTTPTATIGGTAATVLSAAAAPGQPGVYQIQVQIPAGAGHGDMPVVLQTGTFSSAPVLLTLQ